jgi:hypothetical protein
MPRLLEARYCVPVVATGNDKPKKANAPQQGAERREQTMMTWINFAINFLPAVQHLIGL